MFNNKHCAVVKSYFVKNLSYTENISEDIYWKSIKDLTKKLNEFMFMYCRFFLSTLMKKFGKYLCKFWGLIEYFKLVPVHWATEFH